MDWWIDAQKETKKEMNRWMDGWMERRNQGDQQVWRFKDMSTDALMCLFEEGEPWDTAQS